MKAILLAAGMGTRLRPITLTVPKSLVEVNGKPLLERQIEMLRERGVEEIIVLTGYLTEKFDYLKEKFGVNLIYNDKFNVYNNIYTMYLVREYLNDSYVIDADIYLNRNFIEEEIATSKYFTAYKENFEGEWKVHTDNEDNLTNITVESGDGYILSGVSYWSSEDGKFIAKKLEEKIESEDFKDLYWDDIVKENIKHLNIKVKKLSTDDVYEIDNLEELKAVKRL
ncbi:MAG: sugar phosphate nucleotidyltransferase, partial [Sarcina sp.]